MAEFSTGNAVYRTGSCRQHRTGCAKQARSVCCGPCSLGLSHSLNVPPPLYFAAIRRILSKQTSLSARFAVVLPAGGEMSGLTAHFLFGSKCSLKIRGMPGGWGAKEPTNLRL